MATRNRINVVDIGSADIILELPASTMLVTAWNAVWTVWQPSISGAMVIYMPDNTAIVSNDPAATVATPGSEPMIILNVSTHRGCKSDTHGTNPSGRGQGHRIPIIEKHTVLSKIDGTAHFIYPHETGNNKSLICWMAGTYGNPGRNPVDLSPYPAFKLVDMVGEVEFKKLASKAKTRFRKLMR